MKRRDFHRTALAVGAAGFPGIQTLSTVGANNRIRIAVIGCGVRGSQHIPDIIQCQDMGVELSHVCDVWSIARDRAVASAQSRGQKTAPKAVENYEDILNDPSVDAVVIATPDFSHAKILKEAAEAGKDGYCEKPFAVDLKEGVAAVNAVRANKRVVQIGAQWRSDGNYIAGANAVHSGVLGKITRISIAQNFIQPRWRKDYSDVKKDDVNWDLFQLHHAKKPFSAKRFKRWYLYRDYTNGLPGLWLSHYLNAVAWYMQDLFPYEVTASAAVLLWNQDDPDDDRETADTLSAILDYPSGFQLNISMSLCNSADTHFIVYGTNGKLDVQKRILSGDGGAGDEQIQEAKTLEPVKNVASHMRNWLECIRTREDPCCSIEYGLSHSVAGIMVAESNRVGKRLKYDPQKREILYG
ncbi:MAG: Gfo/Idh/MocA family oxidoreductase [Candidatus Omnitrophica bacterium]|nr:Gfo/Idh/MocA family oxidoreductase [Candidatus Omnitrophota bacterium]